MFYLAYFHLYMSISCCLLLSSALLCKNGDGMYRVSTTLEVSWNLKTLLEFTGPLGKFCVR